MEWILLLCRAYNIAKTGEDLQLADMEALASLRNWQRPKPLVGGFIAQWLFGAKPLLDFGGDSKSGGCPDKDSQKWERAQVGLVGASTRLSQQDCVYPVCM